MFLCIGDQSVLFVAALLVYDYLITFDREYRFVWKRRFSAATLLFLLARHCLLLTMILIVPMIYFLSPRPCSALAWLETASQLLFILLVLVFSSLRAYALSGRQWKIASLIFIVALVPLGILLFEDVRQVVVIAPPPIHCFASYSISPELLNILTYVRHGTSIAVETLVLSVTIRQTYWQRRTAAEVNLLTPLHTVILRDGTVYFLALLMMNVADIALAYLGDFFASSSVMALSSRVDISPRVISPFLLKHRVPRLSDYVIPCQSRPSFVASLQFAASVGLRGVLLDREFSFSPIDSGSLDEQGAYGEGEHEAMLEGNSVRPDKCSWAI